MRLMKKSTTVIMSIMPSARMTRPLNRCRVSGLGASLMSLEDCIVDETSLTGLERSIVAVEEVVRCFGAFLMGLVDFIVTVDETMRSLGDILIGLEDFAFAVDETLGSLGAISRGLEEVIVIFDGKSLVDLKDFIAAIDEVVR